MVIIERSKTNTRKVYVVAMGLSVLGAYLSEKEAKEHKDKIEPMPTHVAWGSQQYIYPYVIEYEPGDLSLIRIYPGMVEIGDYEKRGVQGFNYIPAIGFDTRVYPTDKHNNKIVWKEF